MRIYTQFWRALQIPVQYEKQEQILRYWQFFFNLFFAYSNFLDSHWDFTFRCVLGTKQQDLCTISSKKGTTVQHVFSCSISTGHKEFQISFLWKKHILLFINPGLSIRINKRNWSFVSFFPCVFRCQYLEHNIYSVQPLKIYKDWIRQMKYI